MTSDHKTLILIFQKTIKIDSRPIVLSIKVFKKVHPAIN